MGNERVRSTRRMIIQKKKRMRKLKRVSIPNLMGGLSWKGEHIRLKKENRDQERRKGRHWRKKAE